MEFHFIRFVKNNMLLHVHISVSSDISLLITNMACSTLSPLSKAPWKKKRYCTEKDSVCSSVVLKVGRTPTGGQLIFRGGNCIRMKRSFFIFSINCFSFIM